MRRRRRYQLRLRRTAFPIIPSFKTALLPGTWPLGGRGRANLYRAFRHPNRVPEPVRTQELSTKDSSSYQTVQGISFKMLLGASGLPKLENTLNSAGRPPTYRSGSGFWPVVAAGRVSGRSSVQTDRYNLCTKLLAIRGKAGFMQVFVW